MSNYVTQMSKSNGVIYKIMDDESRTLISNESTARAAADNDVASSGNAAAKNAGIVNLLSAAVWTFGYAFDATTGEPISTQYTTDYSISDYIPVTPPFHLYWATGANTTCSVVAYDSEKHIVWKYAYTPSTHLKPGDAYISDPSVAYVRYERVPDSAFRLIDQFLYYKKDTISNPVSIYGAMGVTDLLGKTIITKGTVVRFEDGQEQSSQYVVDYSVTDYIEVKTPCRIVWGYGYRYDAEGTKIAAVCTYNASKQFLHAYFTTGEEDGAGSTYEFDESVKYIRYNIIPKATCSDENQYLATQEIGNDSNTEFYKELLDFNGLVHAYIHHGEECQPGTYTQYWYCTDYIEIPREGCTISWRAGNLEMGDTIEAIALYDTDKNYLYSVFSTDGVYAPGKWDLKGTSEKYVRYNVAPYQNVDYGEQYLNCYINKVEKLEGEVESLINTGSVRTSIVLAKDGTGDFTTWRSATEYCWTHPNTDVYVNGGVYDLVQEYGEEYFQNIPSTYDRNHSCGPECGYNCRYIFSAGAKLEFNYTGSTTLVATYFSPVNIVGSCEFVNMRIECSNCRYCVHEDMPCFVLPIPKDVKVKYINCHMTHSGNTLGTYRETWCIGAGGGIRSVSDIIGGVFESDVGSITYHLASQGGTSDCEVHIKDAYCTGGVQTSDFPEANQGTIYFDVCGCSLIGEVNLGEKAVGHIYNNEIRNQGE